MKRNKIKLGIAVVAAVLALSLTGLAADQVFVTPDSQTISLSGNVPAPQVTLSAFCNSTPCDIRWTVILSNSQVGSIDTRSGPVVNFTMGAEPGTAYIAASDGHGHSAVAKITVQK